MMYCDQPPVPPGEWRTGRGGYIPAIGEFMPLNDSFPLGVAFVTRRDPSGFMPIGTCFFIGYEDAGILFEYAVTAAHVVRSRPRETYIRLRRKAGGVQDVAIPEWTCHPHIGSDVALSLVVASHDEYDYRHVPMTVAVDRYQGGAWKMRLGDRVYFIGLLSQVPTMADAGIPMVRSGTLGALYQDGIPVELPGGVILKVRGHLMDCFAYSGFSGSPCFVQRDEVVAGPAQMRLGVGGVVPSGRTVAAGETTLLLGLHSAHFAVRDSVEGGDTSTALRVPVNAGVGIVTPTETIHATLQMENLVADRQQRRLEIEQERARQERDSAAVADAAPGRPEQATPGPEPERLKIKGDWESAVGRAVRAGRPPKGDKPRGKRKR